LLLQFGEGQFVSESSLVSFLRSGDCVEQKTMYLSPGEFTYNETLSFNSLPATELAEGLSFDFQAKLVLDKYTFSIFQMDIGGEFSYDKTIYSSFVGYLSKVYEGDNLLSGEEFVPIYWKGEDGVEHWTIKPYEDNGLTVTIEDVQKIELLAP
jgi:hypothetical protein